MAEADIETDKSPGKTALENIDLIVKVVLAILTFAIGVITFQLNFALSDLKQGLDERRFGQDQINAAYDRVDKYLALETVKTTRCNAIVMYVRRLPDSDLVTSLMEILSAETSSLCVQDAASEVVLIEAEPSDPTGLDSFKAGFLFAENSSENTDIAVYACDNASDINRTVEVATAVGNAIGASNSFGRVKGAYWRGFDGLTPEHGKITFVVDKGHPEARKLDELRQLIMPAVKEATFVERDNAGAQTRWFISIIACE